MFPHRAVLAGPDEAAGVVVGHDQQVALPLAVGNLVDPDPPECASLKWPHLEPE